MSESESKPTRKPADPPPSRGEMLVRNLFGNLYIASLAFVRVFPERWELAIIRPIARFFRIPEEKLCLRNAPMVYGAERASTLLDSRFLYQCRLKADITRLLGAGPAGILARVKVSGEENLRAAMAEGKGVLLVSAHAGTWWHAPAVVAALGMPVSSVLMRDLPKAIVSYLDRVAQQLKCALTFVRMGAYEAARESFRNGGAFYLSFDFASRPDRAVRLPVGLRGEIPIDTGPGIMAIRHQVPVVWVDTYHDENGKSCIDFLPAIHAGRGQEFPDALSVLHYFMSRLENQIERHPEQWWMLGHCYLGERSASSSSSATESIPS